MVINSFQFVFIGGSFVTSRARTSNPSESTFAEARSNRVCRESHRKVGSEGPILPHFFGSQILCLLTVGDTPVNSHYIQENNGPTPQVVVVLRLQLSLQQIRLSFRGALDGQREQLASFHRMGHACPTDCDISWQSTLC